MRGRPGGLFIRWRTGSVHAGHQAGFDTLRDLGEEVPQVGVRLEGQGVELAGLGQGAVAMPSVNSTRKCFRCSVKA